MAVSSPATMASIVAEFGGVAPHNLSEYYRGGSYTTNGPPANANISVAIAGLQISQFAGAVKFTPSLAGGSLGGYRMGATASATLQFNTNGTLTKTTSTTTDIDTLGTTWGTPSITSVGSGYWLVYDIVSGSFSSASMSAGVYTQLSSPLSFTRNRTSQGQSTVVANFYISNTSNSSGIVASAQITVYALWDIP